MLRFDSRRSGFSREKASGLKPLLLLLLSAALIAGCAKVTKPGKPAPRKAPSPATQVQPRPPDKGDPQARFNAALELMKTRKLPEAEQAFFALARDFPDFSGPYTNLGIIYAKSNRREQALVMLSKATALNSRNHVAWNWLGVVARESGNTSRAEQAYNRALSAKPDYALAHLNLGILYDQHLNQPQNALRHYREYQRFAGSEQLQVVAWIADLEARNPVAATTPLLPGQLPGQKQTAPSAAPRRIAPQPQPQTQPQPVRRN